MSREELTLCYFKAGGRTLAAIEAFAAAHTAHWNYMTEFAAELGCGEGLYSEGAFVCGFRRPREGGIPAGLTWRTRTPRDMLVPDKKTAEGKAIAKRMAAAPPAPRKDRVKSAAGVQTIMMIRGGGLFENPMGWEKIGDVWIASLVEDKDGSPIGGVPFDSERVLTSTYWQLKEAEQAAAKVVVSSTPAVAVLS